MKANIFRDTFWIMEIRNLKVSTDPKILHTFVIYINEWNLSLYACEKRGKREGTTFICPFSKMDDGQWIDHWAFDEETKTRFMGKVRQLLKDRMNSDGYDAPSVLTQHTIPL